MGSNAIVLTLELDCSSAENPRYLVFPSSTSSTFSTYPGPPLAAPTGDSSYGCPASSPLTNPPSPAFPYKNKILVGVGTAFQSMQGGIVYSAQVTFATQSTTTTGTSAYRLDYDTGADFPSDGVKSSPAWVWAVGFTNGSATEWVIESAQASQLGAKATYAAMLVQQITAKHFDQATECGFYQVPFSFTLTLTAQ
jgi:hypothetical protein